LDCSFLVITTGLVASNSSTKMFNRDFHISLGSESSFRHAVTEKMGRKMNISRFYPKHARKGFNLLILTQE